MSPVPFYRVDNEGDAGFPGGRLGVIAGVLLATAHDLG